MVTFRLIKLTDQEAIYEYYPEGEKKEPGEVCLNRKTGERQFLKESEGDFGRRYACHALRRIEEYNKTGEFKQEDMVAWY